MQDTKARGIGDEPWPNEIRVLDEGRTLRIAYDDDAAYALSAELLRVRSPSAEVQGHGPGQRTTQFGKRNVAITEIVPTGNYAVRLLFDDHHSTGIYSFAYLHELAVNRETKWRAYLDELKEKGLARDALSKA